MRRIFLLLILTCSASIVSADDVLLSASDDINQRLEEAQPGDHFKIQNGIWTDHEIRFAASGTALHPIVVEAETPGQVIFSGNSKFEFGGQHITVRGFHFKNVTTPVHVLATRRSSKELASHCRVTECAFTNTLSSNTMTEQKWLSVYGTHNRIDHCHFSGKETDGPTLVVWIGPSPNHHRIDHNYFGLRKPLGRNGGETIRIGTSNVSMKNSRTLVERNLFEECDGEAEAISNKTCENIYRGNTFRRCSGTLSLRHGNRCLVEENFFLGEGARGTGGVRIIGEDHIVINNFFSNLTGDDNRSALSMMNGIKNSPLHKYFQVKNPIVAFNTFIHCKVTFTLGVGASPKQNQAPINSLITNNIIVSQKKRLVIIPNGEPINSRYENNLEADTLEQLKLKIDANGIARLQKESPAIGSASKLWDRIKRDINGFARGNKPFDIGCEEQTSTKRPPLTKKETGPTWLTFHMN